MSRRLYLLLTIPFVAACVCLLLPLASVPGYESAMVLGFVLVPVAGLTILITDFTFEQCGPFLSKLLLLSLSLLPAFAVLHLNTLRVGGCGLGSGLGFLMLLPVVSMLFAACVARGCQNLVRNTVWSTVLFLAVVLASLLFTLGRVVFAPQVFAFNPFFGFFPGPIYDPALPIDQRLILYRGVVLLMAGWWLLVPSSWRPWQWTFKTVSFCLVSVLLTVCFYNEGRLGFFHSRSEIMKRLGGHEVSEHIELVYDKRLLDKGFEPQDFLSGAEFWLADIEDTLEMNVTERAAIFVYADAASKKYLMGAGSTLLGDPINRILHILPIQFPDSILQHELTHVLAGEFGMPVLRTGRNVALLEGLAVAVEKSRQGLSNHIWARVILEQSGENFDSKAIIRGLAFFKYPEIKSYMIAGSFIEYVIDHYGVGPVKNLYASGNYQRAIGKEFDQIFSDWQTYLSGQAVDEKASLRILPQLKQKSLLASRCPHEAATLRDHGYRLLRSKRSEEALACFVRSYQLSGGETRSLVGLLRAQQAYDPSDLLTQYELAWLLKDRGRFPRYAHSMLARILLRGGDVYLSMLHLNRALAIRFSMDDWLLQRMLELGLSDEAQRFVDIASKKERIAFVKNISERVSVPESIKLWWLVHALKSDADGGDDKRVASTMARILSGSRQDPMYDSARLALGAHYFHQREFSKAMLFFAMQGENQRAATWLKRVYRQIRTDEGAL